MTDVACRPVTVPLVCGLCLVVQVLLMPELRLPLPIGAEDVFIADWLRRTFPLQVAPLHADEVWRIFSYALLHGSWGHLVLNLFGLWITGITLEKVIGRVATLFLILTGCAAGAAGFFAGLLLDPRLSAGMTCIGASAILTACIGAVTTLALGERVTLWIIAFPVRLPAALLLPLMFLIFGVECAFPQFGTAYGAHLGGWLAGLLGGLLLRKRLPRSNA